jgi:uncharacterized protein (UPF0248 family)
MIPIQDLLHRIQWDPEFGGGDFVIGYFDRRLGDIIKVPFQRISLEPGSTFSFELFDELGKARMIPLHRVRAVWHDGKLIWHRTVA